MKKALLAVIACSVLLTACQKTNDTVPAGSVVTKVDTFEAMAQAPDVEIPEVNSKPDDNADVSTITEQSDSDVFDYSMIPEYNGEPYVEVHDNVPFAMDEWESGTEYYSPLDELGRCGVAYGCIGKDTMPRYGAKRGEIGNVKPSGWHVKKYPELIEDLYLYNRCHLIAWCLGEENDNPKNLITGTRYLNIEGMYPWETKVANYLYASPNKHVLYRVTPVFEGNELVCRGVLMEARSVEDDHISFCVFCYNVQPGIEIDYETGGSFVEGVLEKEQEYVLNTKSHIAHTPDCESAGIMSEKNRFDYTGKADSLILEGYEPCHSCTPW